MACPPSSRMPTSNETRVRVDDFEKISAQMQTQRPTYDQVTELVQTIRAGS